MQLSHQAEQAIIAASSKTTIVGGSTAAVSGVAEKTGFVDLMGMYGTEIAAASAVGGLLLAFLGFLLTVYFNYRRDLRETRESQWRMGIDPDRRHNDE